MCNGEDHVPFYIPRYSLSSSGWLEFYPAMLRNNWSVLELVIFITSKNGAEFKIFQYPKEIV